MEAVAWIAAAAFALLALYLAVRAGSNPYPGAVARLASELDGPGPLPAPREDEPEEVARLREALRERTPSRVEEGDDDPQARALRGLFRYLEGAVLRPLESTLGDGGADVELHNAVDALRDLEFYAEEEATAAEPRRETLQSVIQSVTREYALETGTPVKFSGPDVSVPVVVAAELFKDALYLLLANAGHFGRGNTVEVVVEPRGDEVEVRIRDRGPGFTEEALKRAFEPFWSSESDALGLGLHRSRELLDRQGVSLDVRNREGGGAESILVLPRAR